ncbi:MAG: hypothetical protein LW731_08435 [Oxalobacteraceae bacterium]|nr:hypothetical protein [Oxalobacteraceae bacterium]
MDTRELFTDRLQDQSWGHADWLLPYLAECESLWHRENLPQHTVLLLVAGSDYAGNLVLSQLRSQQTLSIVLIDCNVTLAYAPRDVVKASIEFIYDSLSLEFTPPEIQRLVTTTHPVLVFADTEVFLLDGAQNFPALV